MPEFLEYRYDATARSIMAVVTVVIVVLLVPVLLIVRDAEGGALRSDVVARLAVIAAAAMGAAALLAGVQARQLARPLERLARSASRIGDGDFSAAAPPPSGRYRSAAAAQ